MNVTSLSSPLPVVNLAGSNNQSMSSGSGGLKCVWGVPHDRATIQRLPGWSPEMDSRQSLTPVKQDRMRHRWRGGVNWTGIFLDSSGVCSREKDISRRYLQDVGDTLLLSSRWRVMENTAKAAAPTTDKIIDNFFIIDRQRA
jgi:hypothetical protein